MKKVLIVAGAIIALGIAYYLLSPLWHNKELNEISPLRQDQNQPQTKTANGSALSVPTTEPKVLAQAPFKPQAHEVKGQALLIEESGQYTIRFENFETINGPDVNIYLASSLDIKDAIDLGDIKATKGNVNYAVPSGVDIHKYNKVLVWCKAFSILFSYAELE